MLNVVLEIAQAAQFAQASSPDVQRKRVAIPHQVLRGVLQAMGQELERLRKRSRRERDAILRRLVFVRANQTLWMLHSLPKKRSPMTSESEYAGEHCSKLGLA